MLSSFSNLRLLVLACLWGGSVAVWAQQGSLQVDAHDPSGAAVAADVVVEDIGTGARTRSRTNGQGRATMTDLPYGRYRVTVSLAGFAASTAIVTLDSASVAHQATLRIAAPSFHVDVIRATTLPGVDVESAQVPAPVQSATAEDIDRSFAINLADLLNRRLNGVFMNEIQGNPHQPDVNYRGYTASPLLGTPQGLSVYMDGVRMNQAFGDVVSWDLMPKVAISETSLIPGSNPLFGLITLGGAIAVTTKDGYTGSGTVLSLAGGSFGRKAGELQHGGHRGAWNWFGATSLFFEDGWRQDSPSNVRQYFGRIGHQAAKTSVNLSLSHANNSLIGNGLQEARLLARDYTSIYTKPDVTANRSPFLIAAARHAFSSNVTFSGNAYYRYLRTRTLNGDINEGSLDQSVYQPSAADQAALRAAGFSGFPTAGASAANTPFPFWRCIAQALLRDEPGEKCNGLINRTYSRMTNYGLSGQLTWFRETGARVRNQFTIGAALDRNRADFEQSTQLGYLNPDRSITGVNAFADGVTGGDVDGVPYDNRVNLNGKLTTGSFFLTDTISVRRKLSITLSGRLNRTSLDNFDRISPKPGSGSLTSSNRFTRFNPAAGLTYALAPPATVYFGYSEGSRAPTSIELGCADPNQPCKLPNALAGDPPLKQVVTRTIEAGVRGNLESGLTWSAGWFRGSNRDDILFVASKQTGFGYFKNFGKTLRQGVELNVGSQFRFVTFGGGYTLLQATFQSREVVLGAGNSSNDAAAPGLEGDITIRPGNHIPLIPRHMGKFFVDAKPISRLTIDLTVNAFAGAYARGNENNLHRPTGAIYLSEGRSPGYAVANLGGRFQVHRMVELWAQVNNLFDKRYYSAAQLGSTGLTAAGTFIARPFPAIRGEYPLYQSTFFAPGAPRGAWGGLRLRF
jgi:outer membrane receptor protein involved in Fe transport